MLSRTTFRRARFVAAALIALVGASAGAQNNSSGDPDRGRRLFYDHGCYGCHGFNGETGARDLVGTGSVIIANLDAFTQFLRARADVAPLLPSTRMPNYPENALSDAEVRDIFAFVSTLEHNAPDVEDIPVFRAILESAERPYEP